MTAAHSVHASSAARLGGIRQHKQIQTAEELQGERDHRQEAHRGGVLLLQHYGDDVDDDGCRKGHGQPAVGLPNPLVPVQPKNFSSRSLEKHFTAEIAEDAEKIALHCFSP